MVGYWNRRIFTPSWVASTLNNKTEIECEVPIEDPSNPIRFKIGGMTLGVQARRITVWLETSEDAVYERAKDLTIKILTELPHTPISAVGVNFRFNVDNPDPSLLKVFQTSDLNLLSDAKASIHATTLTRKLEFEEKKLNLNLILNEDGKMQIGFNFHHNADGTDSALTCFTPGIVPLKLIALKILRLVYNITPE